MKTAEVINQGSVQSVRLPADIRIEGSEVFVTYVGRSVLLVPKDSAARQTMLESLAQFAGDYMEDQGQPEQEHREAVFPPANGLTHPASRRAGNPTSSSW